MSVGKFDSHTWAVSGSYEPLLDRWSRWVLQDSQFWFDPQQLTASHIHVQCSGFGGESLGGAPGFVIFSESRSNASLWPLAGCHLPVR